MKVIRKVFELLFLSRHWLWCVFWALIAALSGFQCCYHYLGEIQKADGTFHRAFAPWHLWVDVAMILICLLNVAIDAKGRR